MLIDEPFESDSNRVRPALDDSGLDKVIYGHSEVIIQPRNNLCHPSSIALRIAFQYVLCCRSVCRLGAVTRATRAPRRRNFAWSGSSSVLFVLSADELIDLAGLRRAKDLMDRRYEEPLDVPQMARAAAMSPAHFSRRFKAAYGETPYAYLMTRRIERAKALLRRGHSVTDACFAVGCTSLGSFSSRFSEIVGETPSEYRNRDHTELEVIPECMSRVITRPLRYSNP